ncbi:5706_t:CDS:1, partial [Acaulospora morrowiae]
PWEIPFRDIRQATYSYAAQGIEPMQWSSSGSATGYAGRKVTADFPDALDHLERGPFGKVVVEIG